MDLRLYDTSLTLYGVADSSLPYRNLLQANQSALNGHAARLREYLGIRPKYEDDEEKEKIGGLRDCTWTAFHDPPQSRRAPDALTILLTYDRVIYKFVLWSNSSSTRPDMQVDLPLLLVKASSAVAKRFLNFLAETFHVTVNPLKLPNNFLASTVSAYISGLHYSFERISNSASILSLLKDTVGSLKFTISVNSGSANGAEIAQHLRNMDIDVPAETLYQLLTSSPAPESAKGFRQYDFLLSLQHHIQQRTGLILPLLPSSGTGDDMSEPPLKLSRIANSSFALSTEGRLKFSSKAYEALEARPGVNSDEDNVVEKANAQLLKALVAEAMKNG